MLKGIDRCVSAELIQVLMAMGHGDDIVLCDVNHPSTTIASQTTHGSGCELPRAIEAVLSLMPLDRFVPAPIFRMQVVGDPDRVMPIHERVQATADRLEGRSVGIAALERFEFYAAAKKSFAICRTSDPGPYGCFIFRKGVIDFE
jgi:L-fucose mutarotase